MPDRATGERQLHAGTLDALENGSPESVQMVVHRSLSEDLRSAFTALAAAGARHAGQPPQG